MAQFRVAVLGTNEFTIEADSLEEAETILWDYSDVDVREALDNSRSDWGISITDIEELSNG